MQSVNGTKEQSSWLMIMQDALDLIYVAAIVIHVITGDSGVS